MIMIEVKTREERDKVIDKALGENHYVIYSIVGILVVHNPDLAVVMFQKLCQKAARALGEDTTAILEVLDDAGRTAISIHPNTAAGVFLYGMKNADFMKYKWPQCEEVVAVPPGSVPTGSLDSGTKH